LLEKEPAVVEGVISSYCAGSTERDIILSRASVFAIGLGIATPGETNSLGLKP
jgi:hypothetical protein